jgi:hypothetical protein
MMLNSFVGIVILIIFILLFILIYVARILYCRRLLKDAGTMRVADPLIREEKVLLTVISGVAILLLALRRVLPPGFQNVCCVLLSIALMVWSCLLSISMTRQKYRNALRINLAGLVLLLLLWTFAINRLL